MKQRILIAVIMGTITTGMVSLTLGLVNKGFVNGFMLIWFKSWLISYLVAVPSIVVIGPKVQALLNNLVKQDIKQ